MNLHKILKIVGIVLSLIAGVFALIIMTGDEATADSMSGNILMVSYVILAVILVLVTVYIIKGLFTGNIKKTLMSVGVFLGIMLLAYILSSGTDLDLQPFNSKGLGITEAISKNVGAGLYMFYILAFFAMGVLLFFGVKKTFNK